MDDFTFDGFTENGVNMTPILDSEGEALIWSIADLPTDSGMNRGDTIKRDGNVTHVRFKAVDC